MGLYPHKFINVMVNNFEFKRFSMDDVIYLTYSNQKLEDFSMGLFEDYGEIFGRMIDLQLMNNQVRGVLNIDTTQFKAEDGRAKLQGYIDMMFEAFKTTL